MIVARVRHTIVERQLVRPGMCVLAACSGGPDSTAMLWALARLAPELRFSLRVASVDHGLRETAAEEVEIARKQAEALEVPFHPVRIEVPKGASLQAEARAARYAALTDMAAKLKAQRIAVGHTQDDQAETVVMRILRGAGVDGLAGIDPCRADGVIRPLIDCRRHDVHRFAGANCREIAEDPSNWDPRFERVRIRHHVLPVLQAEDPAAVQHLCDLADDAREYARAMCGPARQLLEQARLPGGRISRSAFGAEHRATRRAALRIWVREQTGIELGRSHLAQLDRAVHGRAEVWLPGGWAAVVTEDAVRPGICVLSLERRSHGRSEPSKPSD